MVQRLRLGEGQVPEEKIQEKLDEVFKGQPRKVNSVTFIKFFEYTFGDKE